MRHLLITCLLCVLAVGAYAQSYLVQGFIEPPGGQPSDAARPPAGVASPGGIGPDQAAAIARAQTGGRVLDVQRVPNEGREAFAVRLLLDAGRVRTVVVDGQSGQLR